MKRFLWGLAAGSASAGATWLLSHHAILTAVIGVAVALVIWLWNAVDAVVELTGDAIEAIVGAMPK